MFYSLTGKATVIGDLYDGSMLDGDREATAQEVAAWEVQKPPKPIDEIRAIERSPQVADAMARATRLVAMAYALDEFVRAAALKGQTITREQAHAWAMLNDSNYKTLFDAEQLIRPMRARV